jgi:hypothetical protein
MRPTTGCQAPGASCFAGATRHSSSTAVTREQMAGCCTALALHGAWPTHSQLRHYKATYGQAYELVRAGRKQLQEAEQLLQSAFGACGVLFGLSPVVHDMMTKGCQHHESCPAFGQQVHTALFWADGEYWLSVA